MCDVALVDFETIMLRAIKIRIAKLLSNSAKLIYCKIDWQLVMFIHDLKATFSLAVLMKSFHGLPSA